MDFAKVINVFYPSKVDGYFREELPNARLDSTAINVLAAIAIVTLASVVTTIFGTAIASVFSAIGGDVRGAVLSGSISFMALGINAVLGFVGFFVAGFVLHIIAKVLGGKATAGQLLYLLSIIVLALSPISAVIELLSIIPCVGCLLLPVSLAIIVYNLYLDYKTLRVAHSLDSGKSIIALVLWIIVIVIIYAILIALLFFLGLASILGLGALETLKGS